MPLHRAGFLSLLTLLLVPGCSDSGSDGDTIINSLFRGSLNITANGGSSSGAATSTGGDGGMLSVTSGRNIFVGVNPPPLSPALPSTPTTGTPVVSWTDTQTISSGNAIINGNITAATTGFEATLNVTTGDLIINGTLTSADNGAFETGIVINVPAGTVWIRGTIRTGRVDGVNNGDEAGLLTIFAQRIIFTGTIDGRGEDGAAGIGGDGADVTFDTEGAGLDATSQFLAGGSFNLTGGDATGASPLAGDGGRFFTYSAVAANGAVHIHGTRFTCIGGSATGSVLVDGGRGGSLDLQANAGVFFNATFSGAGGSAFASSGNSTGGQGGGFFANDIAVADSGPASVFGSINISGGQATGASGVAPDGGNAGSVVIQSGTDVNLGAGTLSHRGGNSSGGGGEGGDASFSAGQPVFASGDIYFDSVLDVSDGSGSETVAGGTAGFIDFDTTLGDIQLSGTLISNGGNGSNDTDITSGPSSGGTVAAGTGTDGGSITIRATIRANGGSDSDGADDNDGAAGGLIQFLCANPTGSITLDPGSLLVADGGDADGVTPAPFGGNGGQVQLITAGGISADGTVGGNINMRGTIAARGGAGLNLVGSFGGFGGEIFVDSDSSFSVAGGADGRGGDITLHAGATIDASGGPGGSGGDGLNDGITLSVTAPAAVTFDADGLDNDDPGENGVVQNFGLILSRGIGSGAFGGDVLFDGLDAAFNPGPLPGILDLFGSGELGDFLSQ